MPTEHSNPAYDCKPCPFSKLGMIEWLHGTTEDEVRKDVVRKLNSGLSVPEISGVYANFLVNPEKNTVIKITKFDVYKWLERWGVPVPNPHRKG